MITEEHFEALRQIRIEARKLQRTCIERAGAGSLLHMALDPEIALAPSEAEAASLQKLRLVK